MCFIIHAGDEGLATRDYLVWSTTCICMTNLRPLYCRLGEFCSVNTARNERHNLRTRTTRSDRKPSPVRNLRVDVNAENASVTLHWDPPGNASDGYVCITSYDVRFKLSDNSDTYNSRNIDSTSIHLTRTCGLKPLMKYDFEVRARSNDEVGEYTLVVAFIG